MSLALLQAVEQYVHEDDRFAYKLTAQVLCTNSPRPTSTSIAAAALGSLHYLTWALLDADCPPTLLCYYCAANGIVERLEYVVRLGGGYSRSCTNAAAQRLQWHVLDWAVNEGLLYLSRMGKDCHDALLRSDSLAPGFLDLPLIARLVLLPSDVLCEHNDTTCTMGVLDRMLYSILVALPPNSSWSRTTVMDAFCNLGCSQHVLRDAGYAPDDDNVVAANVVASLRRLCRHQLIAPPPDDDVVAALRRLCRLELIVDLDLTRDDHDAYVYRLGPVERLAVDVSFFKHPRGLPTSWPVRALAYATPNDDDDDSSGYGSGPPSPLYAPRSPSTMRGVLQSWESDAEIEAEHTAVAVAPSVPLTELQPQAEDDDTAFWEQALRDEPSKFEAPYPPSAPPSPPTSPSAPPSMPTQRRTQLNSWPRSLLVMLISLICPMRGAAALVPLRTAPLLVREHV